MVLFLSYQLDNSLYLFRAGDTGHDSFVYFLFIYVPQQVDLTYFLISMHFGIYCYIYL